MSYHFINFIWSQRVCQFDETLVAPKGDISICVHDLFINDVIIFGWFNFRPPV